MKEVNHQVESTMQLHNLLTLRETAVFPGLPTTCKLQDEVYREPQKWATTVENESEGNNLQLKTRQRNHSAPVPVSTRLYNSPERRNYAHRSTQRTTNRSEVVIHRCNRQINLAQDGV